MSNQSHVITLIGRPGCHLCDEARRVIINVLSQLEHLPGERVLVEQSVDSDELLLSTYADQIPVVLVDGKVHNFWHIDAQRLRRALAG